MTSPEYSITDKPVSKVALPLDRETVDKYENSGNPVFIVLAAAAVAMAAGGIITLT